MPDTPSPFRFSPRPNRAADIRWREWGPKAFDEALESGKPILLSLSAVWCHWCHVMDETSYSDPGVIEYVNEHYVPVRVDNDQRPDINARYNMGGWPTTAFLTPEGEVLAGATYVPPEQMLDLLPKVFVYYQGNREEVAGKVEAMRQRRAAGDAQRGALSPDIFDAVLRTVAEAYDPVFGGLGDAPKFPHTDALDLLLYAYRRNHDPDLLHMARKTLESMARGEVFDHEWGGFFRYATRRDWSEPHYEKMLEDNANLLRNFLALCRATGDQAHADIARRIVDYMEAKLRDKGAGFFYGSQDADEEFYKLAAAEREKQPEPYIDRTCYTSWNAMAASAYLEASWTLDRPDLRDAALGALAFLWDRCREAGGGMFRFHDGTAPQVAGLLGDQAYTARALLDAHEVTGDSLYLERALELTGFLLDRFHDPAGGFFDTWDQNESLGRLAERQKSVLDNAACADVLIRLHHLTRDEQYAEAARATLEAFVPAYPQLGYFAAAYARQVDALLNPPAAVNIVGDAAEESTATLHSAALRLDLPSRVVQVLHPQRDAARLEALFLPPAPAPAAYVCLDAMCSAPVTRPEELVEAVQAMRTAAQPQT
ncbi:MAG TPA: DUF255 domain-containing protein [Dehalococcoidia bacterium]|nr:DUF255 domain-containing protein [Dehalococcoidia bacterium]